MSRKEEPTGHQPPADPLPDIYESKAFPGGNVWRCWRCQTFMDKSNVEPHRARHQHADAIAAADSELVSACIDLDEDDLRELLVTYYTNPIERLVAAIRARRALEPTTPNQD